MLAHRSRALHFCRVGARLIAFSYRTGCKDFLSLAVAASGRGGDDVFTVVAVIRPFTNWLLQQVLFVLLPSLDLVGDTDATALRTLHGEAVLLPPLDRRPGHGAIIAQGVWRRRMGGLRMRDLVKVSFAGRR